MDEKEIIELAKTVEENSKAIKGGSKTDQASEKRFLKALLLLLLLILIFSFTYGVITTAGDLPELAEEEQIAILDSLDDVTWKLERKYFDDIRTILPAASETATTERGEGNELLLIIADTTLSFHPSSEAMRSMYGNTEILLYITARENSSTKAITLSFNDRSITLTPET